jgi:hypothetical protein
LEIKKQEIASPLALVNINKEYELLIKLLSGEIIEYKNIRELKNELMQVNNKLWQIEEEIRVLEKNKIFDDSFIELARSVYMQNDMRAKIKKEINEILGSELKEEKSYVKFTNNN